MDLKEKILQILKQYYSQGDDYFSGELPIIYRV